MRPAGGCSHQTQGLWGVRVRVRVRVRVKVRVKARVKARVRVRVRVRVIRPIKPKALWV